MLLPKDYQEVNGECEMDCAHIALFWPSWPINFYTTRHIYLFTHTHTHAACLSLYSITSYTVVFYHTHSHTNVWRQWRAKCPAQAHFDTWSGEAGTRTADSKRTTAFPPELQPAHRQSFIVTCYPPLLLTPYKDFVASWMNDKRITSALMWKC